MADDALIVLNVPQVAGALEQWPQIARPEYQAATEASLLGTIPELASYPTAIDGSEYRRSGNLGREWTAAQPEFQAMSSGFEGKLGNNTPYGPYVQDDERQARRMAARWHNTPKRVTTRNKGRIEANYRAACERISAKINKVTA